jgi:hypothetical protein
MASADYSFDFQQTDSSDTSWPGFDRRKQPAEISEWEEHPLMPNIRNIVMTHRMHSPAHFNLNIEVKQAFRTDKIRLTRGFELNVAFCGYLATDYYICRSLFRKDHQTRKRVATKHVQILDASSHRFIPLPAFLDTKYPIYPDSVGDSEMRAWWAGNGKVFDWMGLPTELKEQIIQYCLDQPTSRWDYQRNKKRHNKHQRTRKFEPGVYEIVDRLTDWAALLGVSHQVRAITLRLFFIGNNDLEVSGGFGVEARSLRGFHSVLDRLGRYYQLTEPDSLPTDYTTQAKAECYYHHPRIYPQLKQYATFRHGLRQIYLEMGFIDYMHFFKVTTGEFERYLDPGAISYEVFEQLPYLKKIALRLPRRPCQGWVDNPFQHGPQLFHFEFPCARTLHRVIYERVAEVLTLYSHVKVKGFGDDNEKDRFYTLRQSSMEKSKWTAADYEELYEECDGGVELGKMVQPGSWVDDTEEEEKEQQAGTDKGEAGSPMEVVTADAFFPPKCRCDTKCHMLYLDVEKTRERRG